MSNLTDKFNIPPALFETIKKMNAEENEYQAKVKALMAKMGIKSIGELSPEEKKKFFNTLDSMHKAKNEEVELEEAKSSTGYELYHKDFSSAMAHAYDFAKKKYNIEIDPTDIDRKVAMGPKRPSSGKANAYRLLDKTGKRAIQVQVANLDNKRYELNMYKEDVQLDELSTSTLASYKKKASTQATAADKAGDFKKGDKRYSGIIKATKKQFANDAKKNEEVEITESHFKVGQKVECKASGMKGTVVKVDKPEVGKYYTVKQDSGKMVKYAPDELKAVKNMEEAKDPQTSMKRAALSMNRAQEVVRHQKEIGSIRRKREALRNSFDYTQIVREAVDKMKKKKNETTAKDNAKGFKSGEKLSGKTEPIVINPELKEQKS